MIKNKPIKKNITFNPVKEDTDGVNARRMIWSSAVLDAALKGLEEGKKLIFNPFYEGNTRLLKGDLVFQRTEEEIREWVRCKNDILYFAEKYCKLMTPEGIKHIQLREYQKKYLLQLLDNQLNIYLACRQCAKTTTSAIFILHYICFNIDKNSLVLGNKRKTAVEILDKTKKIFFELPYFLKPGIYKWNEAEIVLDNGCRLMAEATTINSGISFTFHCVLADEFAHVQPNIMDKFYNNLFPTIIAGKAKFIITSTQNGYNLFYRLWTAAEAGENDYVPFKTDWYEVPEWNPETRSWEKRDEEWHRRQVANYGSEEAFNAQFGTNFDISANTLISNSVLSRKAQETYNFINKDLPGVPLSECFYWHPNYNPSNELKNEHIIITVDLAEGLGGDYTTFAITRLIDPSDIKLECVGLFRSNKHTQEDCALALQLLCCYYINFNRLLISFEKNTYGDLFLRIMYGYAENHDVISKMFDQSSIVKYYNEKQTSYSLGIKITAGNKTTYCLLFKNSFERGLIINDSSLFLVELEKFCDAGNGKYRAAYGHDDIIMAMVQLEFVKNTLQYKFLKESFEASIEIKDELFFNPYEIELAEEQMNPIYNRLK